MNWYRIGIAIVFCVMFLSGCGQRNQQLETTDPPPISDVKVTGREAPPL